MVNIGVLASGRGTNLQAIIDAVRDKRLDASIRVVISDHPGAGVLERAKGCSIETRVVERSGFPTKKAFEDEITKVLKERGVELVVLAGFMRILSPTFLDAFPMKIINIHPSLLPSFSGLEVQKRALEYGVKFTGCTVHFVDKGMDTGPIIIQAVVPVEDGDTVETLSARILAEEHRILPQAIELFSQRRLRVEGRRVFADGRPGRGPGDAVENPVALIFNGG
ncbi:MAG: phosphoribosylglycinamide formyltransferase [Thermodesulfobacteriota bacterium]|nr:MAG: phosphoribosylglycinamide formyltransferase [Thermodesulfobacteriota bacterium]